MLHCLVGGRAEVIDFLCVDPSGDGVACVLLTPVLRPPLWAHDGYEIPFRVDHWSAEEGQCATVDDDLGVVGPDS